ncbi:MAG TPA: D-glycero-beta-D-manno-heptose-7-phosphate kinase [Chlamydiales bacterium]|nr:D-glycero-beta-D-manno-heptose-7-phosphate kinase [Chlamydiales bacterium]
MVNFRPFKVLVLGDFLLDTYTTGKVRRISPEAPVPVMEVLRHEERPGGAGNVALSLHALGGEVTCVGRVGDDESGESLKKLLSAMDLSALMIEETYPTPVKNRLIADSQQLLRVDRETITPLKQELEETLLLRLKTLIPTMQVIALSDYGKGFLTNRLICETIQLARAANIPVIVDPKGTDFTKYAGASILKPNLTEAYAAVQKPLSTSLDIVANLIFSQSAIARLLITRSEAGMSLFTAEGTREDFPVVSKEVKDVTGAGDTVLAVLALSLANRLDLAQAVRFANIAAGIAIERLGCVQVTLAELMSRYLKNQTKIFDLQYSFAFDEKNYSLFILAKDQPLSMQFFKKMRASTHENIAYIQDGDEEFAHFLASFPEIGSIICQKETLKALCEKKRPQEIHRWEKDDFVQIEYAKNILQDLLKK